MDKETFTIIRKVHELFKKKGLKLSVAESCTGGLISHYITLLPGAGAFFEAGVVTYSAESKKKILGLQAKTIAAHGVISKETAKEMAERMCLLTKTGCAVSTTGNLGPDVLEGKDIGLIYIAVSLGGETFVRELRLNGKREEIKERAAVSALKFLVGVMES
ncbi:MAG: hypothetical protein COZ31_03660 [Nitrospirae bacterium CG_4_10_14_3_um_filter_44_29]|nr:CinA family protein [Nitrospirota bacterium]OIO30039.1 MAG: hypothetical protein AUJ60_03555 [Nitrospirae bacterium CG1_02_44_142]PIP70856.1 MAG: damage-inducible protein CinA [Nitrospirae bacterium CG22_combo_CG10-13_8_21_14_all_44_11]PIV40451.1 MAG: hypothetical protein COS28_08685 [Nitrospirae bacterium CG02_land_8_20_14_3_00_44_33]PIV66499.1 MAG: hypothetical protein COS10_05845 [Nitrospirae bacterium CG01_land_8_20_14_3_00_44_22]PIW90406.1 MAG: hypothetical protein COZ93_01580 [Nitrosp